MRHERKDFSIIGEASWRVMKTQKLKHIFRTRYSTVSRANIFYNELFQYPFSESLS